MSSSSSDEEYSFDAEFDTLRIPLTDIVIATKDFAEENVLKRGGKADVYKGLLLRSKVELDVVIRKYTSTDLNYKFYKEIKIISRFKLKNIVSFIGFCDERDERMIVMERAVNGSLDKYLGDPTTLTWYQRLHICFGAALASRYWHNETEYLYINKGGFKILLDKDWEAKILFCIESDTEICEVRYCLGMIMMELLYGRKTTIQDVNQYLDNSHYREGDLDDMIAPYLRKQIHTESLSIFSEAAYKCFKSKDGYDIYEIVRKLNKACEIQWKHENLPQADKLAYLKIPLEQIKLATDDFADPYSISWSPCYDNIDVYKAELDYSDGESVLTIEWKKKILIIRYNGKYDITTKDFYAEIELLSSCKHPNIVNLLGFCDEDSEKILVYECDFKVNLGNCVRENMFGKHPSWEQRIHVCLDVAHGVKYLHNIEGQPSIIHHGILSRNVFLVSSDEKLTAKIVVFRLSSLRSNSIFLKQSGQKLVVDYVYFLGLILFEILTWGLVYVDPFWTTEEYVNKLTSVALQHFREGELKNIADPRIMEEPQKYNPTKRGPNQDSVNTFFKIAYQCLEETPSKCPTLEVVIESLEKALHFQVQSLEHSMKIPLEDILSATFNFHERCCIGSGAYGEVYQAELKLRSKYELAETLHTVAIKRIKSIEDGAGKEGFFTEINVLAQCEHPNIVSFLGYFVEGTEMILVYEYASNGSLDDYLGSTDKMVNLSWAQRLKMCIDIAQGLNYLHTTTEDKERCIHRDIKSANILLGKDLEAKIADFGLAKVHPGDKGMSTINTKNCAGTQFYLDPEYARTGRLKKASDIYSFGVVLFEIFSGKLAYDSNFVWENGNGLAPIARKHFEEGTLEEILDQKIKDEAHELIPTLRVGAYHESLTAFSNIAYQCLAETQAKRPKIEEVIKELMEASMFEENRKDAFKFSLEDIKSGVGNFSGDKCITRGGYGKLYRGEVKYINEHKKVVVKRFKSSYQDHWFLREFEVLFKHKQENIIGLVGYCKELNEKIIVYENASNGCISSYLNDSSFLWNTRLNICIDIANGLKFLHEGDVRQDVVIHRDIKSDNILLTEDWKAKICGLEVSLTYPANHERSYVTDDLVGSPGYCDGKTKILTKESDIYAFGVVLFEILCGRLAYLEKFTDHRQFLDILVQRQSQDKQLEDIVFKGIKEQIVPESLVTFRSIAFQCLHKEKEKRPTAGEVLVQLQCALEFQEANDVWKAKLPRNYEEILQYSKSPRIYSTMTEKDIYDILSKGILLQDDKLWFSIGDNGERTEIVSARMFSFKNHTSHRWRSIQESRFHVKTGHRKFHKVAKMLDISNLNIQIKIRPQFLPLDVKYSVHLVFKFYGPRKSRAKRVYVNLKYKMGNENLHAYFATWREDDWMMIELCRFSSLKKDADFEVLLEGIFSRCYCDSHAIYIEGIEFRAIDNVKQKNKEKLEENQQVLTSVSEMKREVYHMVSAESIVYDFPNSKSPAQSSGEGMYMVPQRQVFSIKWHINEYQMMLPNTECACYLVFKLSENCSGLHCPVIVRDQFHWKSKEIIYFRSPSPWNLHDTDQVPMKRGDGWMEVIVLKFNSDSVLRKGHLSGNLKLISYQGTMSGLIIRGLEFRPMEE